MEQVQQYSDEYDGMTAARHAMGSAKYGPVRFSEIDPIQMALEEVADMGNYIRYCFIKLRTMQDAIEREFPGWKEAGIARPTESAPTVLGTLAREGQFISLKRI